MSVHVGQDKTPRCNEI